MANQWFRMYAEFAHDPKVQRLSENATNVANIAHELADKNRTCYPNWRQLECDHVIPVAKGGDHSDGNLVTACFSCNRSKRDKTLNEWMVE